MKAQQYVSDLLSNSGVRINGQNPWDIRVNNELFYEKILTEGSLGLGEAYIEKWWDAQRLDEFFYRVLNADLEGSIKRNWKLLKEILIYKLINRQTRSRSIRISGSHYNLGNNLFTHMLDKRMVYSCGYWKNASTIDEAQVAKMDIICKKLNLQPGMHILDIGCGWGNFAKFAAENYDVRVTGITVSSEQAEMAKTICEGWPIDIKLLDYRLLTGKFDHIVSIGMFEHVGYKNYSRLHACGSPVSE